MQFYLVVTMLIIDAAALRLILVKLLAELAHLLLMDSIESYALVFLDVQLLTEVIDLNLVVVGAGSQNEVLLSHSFN